MVNKCLIADFSKLNSLRGVEKLVCTYTRGRGPQNICNMIFSTYVIYEWALIIVMSLDLETSIAQLT